MPPLYSQSLSLWKDSVALRLCSKINFPPLFTIHFPSKLQMTSSRRFQFNHFLRELKVPNVNFSSSGTPRRKVNCIFLGLEALCHNHYPWRGNQNTHRVKRNERDTGHRRHNLWQIRTLEETEPRNGDWCSGRSAVFPPASLPVLLSVSVLLLYSTQGAETLVYSIDYSGIREWTGCDASQWTLDLFFVLSRPRAHSVLMCAAGWIQALNHSGHLSTAGQTHFCYRHQSCSPLSIFTST